ncbi:MAG: NrsF family protein [Pseudomonadota bacterium]
MNTDDLIRELAADGAAPRRPSAELGLALALPAAFLACCFAVLELFGLRPGLGGYALTGVGALKFLGGLVLAMAAARIAARLARPGLRRQLCPLSIAAAAGVAGVAAALVLRAESLAPLGAAVEGAIRCTWPILALAAPLLAAAMAVLRTGAPTRPAAAGAAAGLASGALGAVAYALHCPADDLLLVSLGYGGAIGLSAIAGAAVGARALSW